MNWRRQQLLEDFRDAQKECTCENNGDLCNPCQAREAIGMSKTPHAARSLTRKNRLPNTKGEYD